MHELLSNNRDKVFAKVLAVNIELLPIPKPSDKKNVHVQNEVIKLVDQLLHLNEEKQTQTLQSRIDQIQNRIDYSEQRINEIVYELYGLTNEEISLIENS